MEAVQEYLTQRGATIAPINTMPGSFIVGYAGRDVICYMTKRTKLMQQFADAWRGVPPVNVLNRKQAWELLERIISGEFDEDSKMSGREIIMRRKLNEHTD